MFFSPATTRTLVATLGEAASWLPSPGGSVQDGYALYDAPDDVFIDGQVMAQAAVVRYAATQWPGLSEGQVITVGGRSLRVIGAPQAIEDGGMKRVAVRVQ